MPKVVSLEQMKSIEAAADKGGLTYAEMMENAGRAVADAIIHRVKITEETRILVLCGSGNNGGDGLVAAHYLAGAGPQVTSYLTKMRGESDPLVARLRERGLLSVDGEYDQRWRVLKNLVSGAHVIVDAILGTGAQLPIKGKVATLLSNVGSTLRDRGDRPVIVAVDCPSGVDCDSGEADPNTLRADFTVTLAAAKTGLFKFPAAELTGEVSVADIGIPAGLPELQGISLELATREGVAASFPARPRNAHKGTFGRALVAAGSVNFTGAAYLAGAAAYRVGAGLVTLAVPGSIYPILAVQLPEATWVVLPSDLGVISGSAAEVLEKEFESSQALLLGPGFGQEKGTSLFLNKLLGAGEETARGRIGFVQSAPKSDTRQSRLPPTVIDADGLKLLAGISNWPARLRAPSVLTPHPGEMAVLTGVEKAVIQSDRGGTASRYARDWGHVVVLKGAFTVVASPEGPLTLIPFATPALARAGTGDVLAGAITGLMAQGLAPYTAAVAAAYLHGLAGELAATDVGSPASVMASDVLNALPRALASVGKA